MSAALMSAALVAGALVAPVPARAEGEGCVAWPITLSVTPTSVRLGEGVTVSWSVTHNDGCDWRFELRGPNPSLYRGGVDSRGSMAIPPDQLSVGENRWSLRGYPVNNPDSVWQVEATVTVAMPDPLPDGTQVTIVDSSQASRVTFVRAVMARNAVVRVAGTVDLDLSNLENIPVAPGVQILGDRGNGVGPRLFTTTVPRALLKVGNNSDGVRISGIRLEGGQTDDPFSGVGTQDSDGIAVFTSQHVEIDNNEIYHWRGAGVKVLDGDTANDPNHVGRLTRDTVEDNSRNVWVHDNYIHHNQHPAKENCLSGGGHAGGYGVATYDGGYVKIERNVFDWNRHAIAGDGSPGSGYVARDNLILQHGGVHFKCVDVDDSLWSFVLNPFVGTINLIRQVLDPDHIYHTHMIDMHGTGSCGTFAGDHNCGDAGEYMDVTYNTILYTSGNGIHLRGTPKVGMFVRGNVFAHSVHDGGIVTAGAMVQNELGLYDQGNTLDLNTFNERKTCDFDGDGAGDSLIATGVAWWYASSRLGGQWVFLNRSQARVADLIVRDVTGDGLCDVTAGGVVFRMPDRKTVDSINMNGSPIAAAPRSDGGVEVIGIDQSDQPLHAGQSTPGGSLGSWTPFEAGAAIRSVAAETDTDGRIEFFGVDATGRFFLKWQVAAGGGFSPGWAEFGGQLRSVAAARNADGRLEVFGANDRGEVWHRWQNTAGGGTGWTGWSQLDGGLAQVAAETNADGRIELFGVNRHGQIWHRIQTSLNSSTSWSGWSQFEGELSSISVARDGTGRLEIFGANALGEIWHRAQSRPGDWAGSAWQPFDGALSQVAAESDVNGRIALYGVNSAGYVYSRIQPAAGSWDGSGWTLIGGTSLRATRPVVPATPMRVIGGAAQFSQVGVPVVTPADPTRPPTGWATDGTRPYHWSVHGLPPGLTMGPTGLISGIPAVKGTYPVSVTVSDSSNPQALTTIAYTWTVTTAQCWGRINDHRVQPIPDLATVNIDLYNGCPGNASATASIAVDITHTYIGDLIIDLIAPSGRVFNLHNRTGGGADNLVKTYPLDLSGELREGLWRLRIKDVALRDTGQLNSMILTL